jgi:hypothetical protein
LADVETTRNATAAAAKRRCTMNSPAIADRRSGAARRHRLGAIYIIAWRESGAALGSPRFRGFGDGACGSRDTE